MLQPPQLKYGPTDFIIEDLRRLKKWKSLGVDIANHQLIVSGLLVEAAVYPPPYNFSGGLITRIDHLKGTFLCFKDRVAITDPFMTPEEGARLVYAIIPQLAMFIPMLVYGAFEEGTMYCINKKKFPLTKSGLGKIINEKLKALS